MSIDPTNLTMIGMGASVISTVLICTWKISGKIALGIQSTENNTDAINGLSATFHGHVLESGNRDKQNQAEHAAINRTLDSQASAIASQSAVDANQGKRLDRMEEMTDHHHVRIAVIETRLDIPRGSHS